MSYQPPLVLMQHNRLIGVQLQRGRRRARVDDGKRRRDAQPDRDAPGGGGGRMIAALSNADLTIAASTIWVVIAAVLVMFMQAGFAFLEAGLARIEKVRQVRAEEGPDLGGPAVRYLPLRFR